MHLHGVSLDIKCISASWNVEKYNHCDEISCAVFLLNFKKFNLNFNFWNGPFIQCLCYCLQSSAAIVTSILRVSINLRLHYLGVSKSACKCPVLDFGEASVQCLGTYLNILKYWLDITVNRVLYTDFWNVCWFLYEAFCATYTPCVNSKKQNLRKASLMHWEYYLVGIKEALF